MSVRQLREGYHSTICQRVLGYQGEFLNIADGRSKRSVELAESIVARMGFPLCSEPPINGRIDTLFGSLTCEYLDKAFRLIQHLRSGQWMISAMDDVSVSDRHANLADSVDTLGRHSRVRKALGDYLVMPDILVRRRPVSDQEINRYSDVLEGDMARLTPLRASNVPDPEPILHASISCKWTIRSDRSQNARTEGLNLIRNRKGNTPHIVIVTAEPLPSRIASLALGTGDLDCVYHMALYELGESVEEVGDETLSEMFNLLVEGKRLRDISDLPFDLAI